MGMIALTLKAPRQRAAITEPRCCDTFIAQRDNKLTAGQLIPRSVHRVGQKNTLSLL